MARDTKQRMVEAAASLFRTKGVAATSFTEVLDASGAARGAIYHHFPEGKAQLAREAVEWTGRSVQGHISAIEANQPIGIVEAFLGLVRPIVEQSAAGAGCAVAAVTMESAQNDAVLTAASNGAFSSWVGELERKLSHAGATPGAATSIAHLLIVFLEGAHVLCRASGDLVPFDCAERGVVAAAVALL
jgi:TetR/AcrR family transcriptional regulator, lmrAB and yxaGH operons repressor